MSCSAQSAGFTLKMPKRPTSIGMTSRFNSEAAATAPEGGTAPKAFGAVPSGDPPLGTGSAPELFRAGVSPVNLCSVPLGRWPNGTGKLPVPPHPISESGINIPRTATFQQMRITPVSTTWRVRRSSTAKRGCLSGFNPFSPHRGFTGFCWHPLFAPSAPFCGQNSPLPGQFACSSALWSETESAHPDSENYETNPQPISLTPMKSTLYRDEPGAPSGKRTHTALPSRPPDPELAGGCVPHGRGSAEHAANQPGVPCPADRCGSCQLGPAANRTKPAHPEKPKRA